jgi:hypothetical protein
MRSCAGAVALLAFVALSPGAALGNGRAPLTNGIHFRPGDPHSLYVASTFGLLVSHDDGCTFRWICEQSIGYGGTFDPKYRVAADGTIFATTFDGLRVSRDGGCSFTTATSALPAGDPSRIADTWIDAIDIGPTGDIWVATADGTKPNNVFRSTDNGVTFAPRGMLSQEIWWKSVAIAPSRAQRIYVTGYQVTGALAGGGAMPPTAHFEITDDDGASWTESPLAGVRFGSTPLVYALGIDRSNPDLVLMSSAGANPPSGDRLYRSIDGGMTWAEVLATPGTLLDLAVAPSGVIMVATLGGAFQSIDNGATFSPMIDAPQLACIGQRDDGEIYGCGANWEPDEKAVASSRDGRTWDKAFRFADLAGPIECPADSPQHLQCDGMWPAVQVQFGATGPTSCGGHPLYDDTPPPDATPPSDATVSPPADVAPPLIKPQPGGCCDTASASSGQLGALGLLAAVCGAVLLRRRRG